jgi:hypothetical protein
MAPLVGHNAFLNKKAMIECAHVDEETGFLYYWAENRISEDFDLMMRGTKKGYVGRYASHAGVFLEGVSFSYMTEYFKLSKFACGAAELIYNPMSEWCRNGIISRDMIGFLKSNTIEWYNKLFMLGYTLNFLALAAAHWGLIYNLLFIEYLVETIPSALLPINLMYESIFVWLICGFTFNYFFGVRMGFDKWMLLKQSARECLFLTCLYGSISMKMSIMCFTHLFNWNMSFGASQKNDEKVTIFDWIKSTPMECIGYSIYAGIMVLRILFYTTPEHRTLVLYYGCVPMMWTIFLFWLGPLVHDILPCKRDKTTQESYIVAEKMFYDKYQLQLPASKLILKIQVGSKSKMPYTPNSSRSRPNSEKRGKSHCSIDMSERGLSLHTSRSNTSLSEDCPNDIGEPDAFQSSKSRGSPRIAHRAMFSIKETKEEAN